MPLGHGFEHYMGIPFPVDMGKSAWSPGGQFPPLPLVMGDTVVEQPANLDTLSVRYAAFAKGFMKNATAAGTPFLLYMAFNHVHQPGEHDPLCAACIAGCVFLTPTALRPRLRLAEVLRSEQAWALWRCAC